MHEICECSPHDSTQVVTDVLLSCVYVSTWYVNFGNQCRDFFKIHIFAFKGNVAEKYMEMTCSKFSQTFDVYVDLSYTRKSTNLFICALMFFIHLTNIF